MDENSHDKAKVEDCEIVSWVFSVVVIINQITFSLKQEVRVQNHDRLWTTFHSFVLSASLDSWNIYFACLLFLLFLFRAMSGSSSIEGPIMMIEEVGMGSCKTSMYTEKI